MEQAEDSSVEGQRVEMSVGDDEESIDGQGPNDRIYIAAMERNMYRSGKLSKSNVLSRP